MQNEFHTLLTQTGLAKLIKARANARALVLKSFKLSSAAIVPKESISSLKDLVYEGSINSRFVDENNPNHLILECVVGANHGGFAINSLGIYDDEGELIAVGSVPFTYKPRLEQGAAKELIFEVVMELANAESVNIALDSSKALATRAYVDNVKAELLELITANSNAILKIFNEKIIFEKEKQ